jgi:hypothetical protein
MIAVLTGVAEYLWARWRTVILIAGAVMALWVAHGFLARAAYNRAFNAGWGALATKNAAEAMKAQQTNDAAKDKAAIERVNDTAIISNQQDTRNDAISKAAPSSTGAATRALGCVRWTQQHSSGSPKPAGC